jgi:single-strand DNA-binding protein
MAASVNKVILLGNVGRDPEFKALPSGVAVANFSLATSEKFKGPNGDQQERTEWHNCQAFERTAEVVRDYVKKGSKLYIEGKIQTRSWDDQSSGEKKYRTEILVRQVTLLSANGQQSAEGSSSDPKGGAQKRTLRGSGTQNIENDEYGDIGITDDDIPPF